MKQRGLLLDRDGVINVEAGYVGSIDRFVFMDGIFDLLTQAQDKGYRLAITTNQSGVGRGYYSVEDYQRLTNYMVQAFADKGIIIAKVYPCFYFSEAVIPTYRRDSFWRKPNPGMLLQAAQDLKLDLSQSIMLGDKISDMQAGKAAGVGTCLWLGEKQNGYNNDYVIIDTLAQALPYLRSQ